MHYRVADPATRFWFGVYSAHRSRWAAYPAAKRRALVHEHAATVFEDHCRAQFAGAGRYWESDLELDLVAHDPEDPDALVIAEVKWRRLSARDRKRTMAELQAKWSRSKLRGRHPRARLVVLDQAVLAEA